MKIFMLLLGDNYLIVLSLRPEIQRDIGEYHGYWCPPRRRVRWIHKVFQSLQISCPGSNCYQATRIHIFNSEGYRDFCVYGKAVCVIWVVKNEKEASIALLDPKWHSLRFALREGRYISISYNLYRYNARGSHCIDPLLLEYSSLSTKARFY